MNVPQEDRPLRQLFAAARRADAAEAPPFHQLGHSSRLERRVRRERRITRLALLVSAASLSIAAVALWFAFRAPPTEPVEVAVVQPREETRPPETANPTPPPTSVVPAPLPDAPESSQPVPVDTPNPGRAAVEPRRAARDAMRPPTAQNPNPPQGEQPHIWVGTFVAEEGEGEIGEKLASGRSTDEPASEDRAGGNGTIVATTGGAVPTAVAEPSDVTIPTRNSVIERYATMNPGALSGSMGPDGRHHSLSAELTKSGMQQMMQEMFVTHGNETYVHPTDHRFVPADRAPVSQLSGDADTASYTNIRRFLANGELPPPNAVRVEEMLNYFNFDYPEPASSEALSLSIEIAGCPWKPEHRLARIGIRAVDSRVEHYAASHLVLVIDASRSMEGEDRLPLVKEMLRSLFYSLNKDDRVSILSFGEDTRVLATAVRASDRNTLYEALDEIEPSGRTDGSTALTTAYRIADKLRVAGVNRVLFISDGDFTLDGPIRGSQMIGMRKQARQGIYLTVLGVGKGNLNDDALERIADTGNGVYHYLDSAEEATRVVFEMSTGLVTVAQDVKLAVGFDPAQVGAWRLIGYENRALGEADFTTRTDGAELSARDTMTVFYELIPRALFDAAARPYGVAEEFSAGASTALTVSATVSYYMPMDSGERLLKAEESDAGASFEDASTDFRFAAGVAQFGLGLRCCRQTIPVEEIERACSSGRRRGQKQREFFDLLEDYRRVVSGRSTTPR